jgi:hypothetical protein
MPNGIVHVASAPPMTPGTADFAIYIDFKKGEGNPSRVFQTANAIIHTLQRLDRTLCAALDSKIEPGRKPNFTPQSAARRSSGPTRAAKRSWARASRRIELKKPNSERQRVAPPEVPSPGRWSQRSRVHASGRLSDLASLDRFAVSSDGIVWRLCADHGRKQETGDNNGKRIAGAALATAL